MPRLVNIVPTDATRRLARSMMADARRTTGGDAALKHLPELQPEQLVALIGALLTQIKVTEKVGRPPLPLELAEDERRRCHAAYRNGDRTPEVVAGEREYQRVNQRARRQRTGLRSTA